MSQDLNIINIDDKNVFTYTVEEDKHYAINQIKKFKMDGVVREISNSSMLFLLKGDVIFQDVEVDELSRIVKLKLMRLRKLEPVSTMSICYRTYAEYEADISIGQHLRSIFTKVRSWI
jgi:hypothetical protein